jgi:hypothetical protein
VDKSIGTQSQIDKDILQCRGDILRARQAVAVAQSQESAESPAAATKTQVKPADKVPAKAEQASQVKAGPKAEPEAKINDPEEKAKPREQPAGKMEIKVEGQKANAQTQSRARIVQKAKAAAHQVLLGAKTKTQSPLEDKALLEKGLQEVKAAVQVQAQAYAKAQQKQGSKQNKKQNPRPRPALKPNKRQKLPSRRPSRRQKQGPKPSKKRNPKPRLAARPSRS